tara:strand:- start:944 stop:1249 length:306 start_codon:yes stop_codon:yes gene_type:complete
MRASCLDDYIFICLLNGKWWTYWQLQEVINEKVGKFYGEPTISASIRNIRKIERRRKYKLPLDMNKEVVQRSSIEGSKGYQYRLNLNENELSQIKERLNGK